MHVVEGGGSFGRHLFPDAAYEAAEASKVFGKPVRLMWHRTDDSRHGRMHPMATSRVRVSVARGHGRRPTTSGTPASPPTSPTASAR